MNDIFNVTIPDINAIPGWLTNAEARALAFYATGKNALEVGSYCGKSAVPIASRAKKLSCVDPFDGRETPNPRDTAAELYAHLHQRLLYNVSVYRTTFDQFDTDERFDFIFIDAEHTARAIRHDIAKAKSLALPGCIIAFHDYRNPDYPDVKKIVDRHFAHAPLLCIVDSLIVFQL